MIGTAGWTNSLATGPGMSNRKTTRQLHENGLPGDAEYFQEAGELIEAADRTLTALTRTRKNMPGVPGIAC